MVLLLVLFAVSYAQKGNAGMWIGMLGLVLLVVSVAGIVLAANGLRDPDARNGRSIVGIFINGILLFGLVGLYIMGW